MLEQVPDDLGPSPRFVSQFLDDHSRPGWRMGHPVVDRFYFAEHFEYCSEDEFLEFLKAMSRSEKPLCSFYGRYGLLRHEYFLRISRLEPVSPVCDRIRKLADDVKERGRTAYTGGGAYESDCLYRAIIFLQIAAEDAARKESGQIQQGIQTHQSDR